MSTTSFIPQIWNAQMLLNFRESAVAANLVNRDYEGNATKGNVVKVPTAGAIAVKDYKAAGRTTSADAVSNTTVDLNIDQEKNFDFKVDDIDRAQSAGSLDVYTVSAGQGLAEDADKFILAQIVGASGASHTTAISAISASGDAQNVLRDLRKTLNKAHVPTGQRVAVVNAEFEALLLDSAGQLTKVDQSGSPAALRDGYIGRLLGFDLYMSENLPNVAKAQVAAWYRPSFAFVSQIEETEAMRAQDSFADRLRGLHVYGGLAVRTGGIATWTNA